MSQHIGYVSLIVRDYDEAIAYFTGQLGFGLVEDTDLGNGKRWVLIAPSGSLETRILLAKAVTEDQARHIGDQAGGRVFLFLHTDDFWRDFHAYKSRGVIFVREPRVESYGTVAVFRDLYGNLWDLVQPDAGAQT